MIYTDMTRRAMILAYKSHHGQVDKAGVPYILHPAHIAEKMKDEKTCTVAWLHDLVEDTEVTLSSLSFLFPEDICAAVDALTRRHDEEYFAYIQRLGQNPLARVVKLADLAHNADNTRLPSDRLSADRRKKYLRARKLLRAIEKNKGGDV